MALLLIGSTWSAPVAAEDAGIIAQSADYFPDQVGNEWRYRGQITEGPLTTVEHKFFSNVSSVTGTKALKGVTVTVYHDTNPGNHGPSDSFYRRDTAGTVYYGSEPGTPFEKQLVPYQIVRFPMKIASSFAQFNRKGVDFGTDLNQDGINEKADAQGDSTVVGQESVTVPAGEFKDAVKVEARMQMQIHLSGSKKTRHDCGVSTSCVCRWRLAIVSKLAALDVRDVDDPVTLAAVGEVENLYGGVSQKIWHKIMIFDRMVAPV